MRKTIFIVSALVLLVSVNFIIYQREKLLASGRIILLELAPVDPRSLMQGDYMALRFKIANDAFASDQNKNLKDGEIVVSVDSSGIGTFKRFNATTPLAADEALLRYRIRNQQPKFASNAFFFEEGHGKDYEKARYGAFRVSPQGDAILVTLHAADLSRLGTLPR